MDLIKRRRCPELASFPASSSKAASRGNSIEDSNTQQDCNNIKKEIISNETSQEPIRQLPKKRRLSNLDVVGEDLHGMAPQINEGSSVPLLGNGHGHNKQAAFNVEENALSDTWRKLLDCASLLIFGVDVHGNVNEWNVKAAHISGCSFETAFRKPFLESYVEKSAQPAFQKVMARVLSGQNAPQFHFMFSAKPTENLSVHRIYKFLTSAVPVRDEEGRVTGALFLGIEKSEDANSNKSKDERSPSPAPLPKKSHRRAFHSLDVPFLHPDECDRRANLRTQHHCGKKSVVSLAYENTSIFGVDVCGMVNLWNTKISEVTGFAKEEVLHKPLVTKSVVPSLRQSAQEVIDKALQGKETSNFYLELHTNQPGVVSEILVNFTTRRDADGNIVGVVGLAHGVTDKTKDSPAASAGDPFGLGDFMHNVNAAIFGIDVTGKVNEWNDKAVEIIGYTREQAMNKPLVSTFVVPALQQAVGDTLERALRGERIESYTLEMETKSKELRYLLVNATTRRGAMSNVIGVVLVAQDVTESTISDKAISDVAHELRQLIDSANAPIFGIDVEGKVNEWNNKTAEITGFTRDEAFGKPLVETFILPKLRTAVHEVVSNALQGTEVANYEIEFQTKSNETRNFLVNATTRRDAKKNIVGVVGVAQDVTETKRHDRAVAVVANELRQLVDKANAPIFGIDVQGNVNEWNDKTAEITGFSKEEALKKPLVESFISPTLRKSVQEILDNALKGKETSNYELEFCTKSGEIRYLLVNATTRRDAYNSIVGVVGVAQDVTKAVQRDRAVRSMARELRQLIDKANAPIFGIDVEGNVNEWNDKTAEITGFSKEEAFGRPLVETFIVPSLQQSVNNILDKALLEDETSNYVLEFRTKSEEVRHLLVNATTRRDAENNVVGVVGVAQDVTEAAKHDRAVAAMANELRQLVDTANAPIFGIDVEGNVNEWNDRTAEITGYTKVEAFGYPLVSTFIVKSLRQSVQEVLDNALRGHETSNYSLEFRTKSREIRHLLVNATTRRDAENNIVGVVGVAQDVTEATKHDMAVAAMARELRQLVDTANAPIFGIDVNGKVNEWNDKTAEITGFSREEAFNKPLVTTFIVPKLRKSVQEILDCALQGNETSNYSLEIRTKSNETRYLLVNATTRRDAESNIVGVVGVAQDVTEDAKHDRAVASMANELRQLVDTANAPIFGIDVHGNVNEWNNKTAEITGFSKEEAVGYPLVSTFIVPSLRRSVQEVMDNALHGNETSNYELEFETKSKEIRYLLVNATTRRDAESNIVGVVGVAQDVTDDRRHSEELREMQYIRASQEAKVETERNMTAYFAHELRNPLHAIDSALISMPDDLQETAKNLVDAMQLCTGFMSSIMNNLLDVRKMEEGKMRLSSSPISLSELLKSVYKMLGASVRPDVEFRTMCQTENSDWVLGDSHRIQQVLTNVVTNAIKYTTDGSIVLKLSWDKNFVCFECIDTGPGIPLKEQDKLFARFVQRGGAPGTGLGLAIAKHLVDLMGGSIGFQSDPTVKPGTTCVVKMPLKMCDPPDVVEDDGSEPLLEESLNFLLIDDITMNRTMLSRRIKKGVAPNAVITEASTGEEALAICANDVFDVIIVDQYMEEAGGVMVGTDVVFAMRRMRINSIIIGCSGNDMDDLFKEAGSDWVWGKPIPTNEVIVKQLRNAIRERSRVKRS